jgi:glycine/serine hydroxymethyltransferase
MIKGTGKPGPNLKAVDPAAAQALQRGLKRQTEKLALLTSENFVSLAVMEAQRPVS